jgi:hypothetical protein
MGRGLDSPAFCIGAESWIRTNGQRSSTVYEDYKAPPLPENSGYLEALVGFKPTTYGVETHCSFQLSYRATLKYST